MSEFKKLFQKMSLKILKGMLKNGKTKQGRRKNTGEIWLQAFIKRDGIHLKERYVIKLILSPFRQVSFVWASLVTITDGG